jgi:glycosyltransferase involved in cell wall biosynthesis
MTPVSLVHATNLLSVIVPCFNEAGTIEMLLNRTVEASRGDWQVIVIDDGSTDGSAELIDGVKSTSIRVLHRPTNGGKSAAVRDGLALVTTPWVIVQDADLEYDPADIGRLLETAVATGDPVYGTRPSCWSRPSRWILASGVLFIDVMLWLAYGKWIRDHATCYKLVPTRMLSEFDLQSTGFEGCVEITAKLMRSGTRIRSAPISYHPRSAREGKKLTWRYGWTALVAVWRYRHWQPGKGS